MYDNKDRRDASFVCEKFDNGIVKGYRYMLPNSNVGAIVIENIYPSINNIQKFKVTVVDWDKGMNMTTFYIRK